MLRCAAVAAAALLAGCAAIPPDTSSSPAFHTPVTRDVEGWTVHVDKSLLRGEHKTLGDEALEMLANHLQRIAILLPEKQLAEMRKLEIWIERDGVLGNMQYHPDVEWLIENGHDPRLEKMVHIPKAANLLSRKQMLKHPAVILHELAHSYHDQVLGFDHPGILAAYDKAMASGSYQKCLLYDHTEVEHYACTDEKEYFAEATEAYFYHNDFYPFVAAELKRHDPTAYALMERIWGKR